LRKGRCTIEWKAIEMAELSVTDERQGCSTTSRTTDNVERFSSVVQEDRRITIIDIVDKLDISCTDVCIFHHPRGPRASQNLCKVHAKAAYIGAQMCTLGNVHVVCEAVS